MHDHQQQLSLLGQAQPRPDRLETVLAFAQACGWAPDPGRQGQASRARWWLPGTAWRFRVDHHGLSLYRMLGAGVIANLRRFDTRQLEGIRQALERVAFEAKAWTPYRH
jgi:hypothetical protein